MFVEVDEDRYRDDDRGARLVERRVRKDLDRARCASPRGSVSGPRWPRRCGISPRHGEALNGRNLDGPAEGLPGPVEPAAGPPMAKGGQVAHAGIALRSVRASGRDRRAATLL